MAQIKSSFPTRTWPAFLSVLLTNRSKVARRIRSFLNLPISYPKTTGCSIPTVGGKLVQNF